MVVVVQLVRTPDCGSGGRRFESGLPPFFQLLEDIYWKVIYYICFVKKLIFLLSIPLISFGQSIDQEEDLPALRLSNNFSKPYRVLKTTISDKSLFQQYYNNTNLTLDYVIRYHFYTSIDLNSEKNQLISMDGTKFNLSSKNALDLTDEVISLVSKMYFGEKEFKEFKELKKKLKNKYWTYG